MHQARPTLWGTFGKTKEVDYTNKKNILKQFYGVVLVIHNFLTKFGKVFYRKVLIFDSDIFGKPLPTSRISGKVMSVVMYLHILKAC